MFSSLLPLLVLTCSTAAWRIPVTCRLDELRAYYPARSVAAEGGRTEYWDQENEQFGCLGIAAKRITIDLHGLLVPTFNSAPSIIYVTQGSGKLGMVMPECPEVVVALEKGDVIPVPAGVPHWACNDGDEALVMAVFLDMTSPSNKLDWRYREFLLAGGQGGEGRPANLLSGYDPYTVSALFGIDDELTKKIQSTGERGHVVKVRNGLHVKVTNASSHTGSCPTNLRYNIENPSHADVRSAGGGRITNLNSDRLPLLKAVKLNAVRGIVFPNAIVSIHWQVNDHSLMYCTEGEGRIQIVNHHGERVFDDTLHPGQLLVLPQFHGVVKHAGEAGLNWTSIKTNDPSVINVLVGEDSTMRSLSEEVLMHSYQLTREEAGEIKGSRGDGRVVFPVSRTKEARAYLA